MDEYQQMYANYNTIPTETYTYTYVNIPECYSLSNLRYHYSPPPPPPPLPPPPPPPPSQHRQLETGYWAAAGVYNMNYYRYGATVVPCSICQYYGVYDHHQVSRMDININSTSTGTGTGTGTGTAWEYASPQEPITNTAAAMPCDEHTTTTPAAIMLPILEDCTSSPQEDAEDGSDGSEVDWQDDIDPDNMTYEELLDLGETVGNQSRGLSEEMIDLLPKSKYKSIGIFSRRRSAERCVICQMRYKRGEQLINLPCKHIYHTDCGSTWLKINKACPICNREVEFD